jgi:hypothetical protein
MECDVLSSIPRAPAVDKCENTLRNVNGKRGEETKAPFSKPL